MAETQTGVIIVWANVSECSWICGQLSNY